MTKSLPVHACAPPPVPSHLSVLWAFDQVRLKRQGVEGAVPRDKWPAMLQAEGVLTRRPPSDPLWTMDIETICYDLQERGWLPMLDKLYARGVWNARADAPRYERFRQLWLQHWRTAAPTWRAVGLLRYHENPLPEYRGRYRAKRFGL